MADATRSRLLLLQAFSLPSGGRYDMRPATGPKESMLMNHADFAPLLADVDWDLHAGGPAPHGDWPIETREEFLLLGASRLPIIREACVGGRYDAIVMLGGGDPGFLEAREIGLAHGVVVTSNAHAQMHVAGMLGHRFSILDIAETHNAWMHGLVLQYGLRERCASIRNLDFPLPRPPYDDRRSMREQRDLAQAGQRSDLLEVAVEAAVAAIEDDGADVLMIGCSALFWLRPLVQRRLADIGWQIPVLEGYACAIAQAKLMLGLGVNASALVAPGCRNIRSRRRRLV